MRSLFKMRSKAQRSGKNKNLDGNSTPPPMIEPIDPDGSTASHSSNEGYLSQNNQTTSASPRDAPEGGGRSQQQQQPSHSSTYDSHSPPSQPEGMTASQFKSSSDEEMDRKRATQPSASPYTKSQALAANFPSSRRRQGANSEHKSRDGVPVITSAGHDSFSPSAVSSAGNYATEGFYSRSKKHFRGKERPRDRPSARTSAFGGAPRYDWMDIETTAAIKIQACCRRLRTQNDLDRRGVSTPGMRNRRAKRRARHQSRTGRRNASADVPFPFNMCGVGLLFGDRKSVV